MIIICNYYFENLAISPKLIFWSAVDFGGINVKQGGFTIVSELVTYIGRRCWGGV